MEILGLPLHPLILHVPVVLVPLVALGGIVISLLRWARERYASLVMVGAFGAAVSTFITQVAGQNLYNSLPQRTAAVETTPRSAVSCCFGRSCSSSGRW